MKSLILTLLTATCLAAPSPPAQSPLQPATITIDLATRYQEIDGFGFSSAFQRSADIRGKKGLSPENTTRVIEYLFSNTDGAGLSILRNGIGSSQNTTKDFMNSIAPTSPGSPDAPLNYTWDHIDTEQVWLSQQALSHGVRTIYADAWSAPAYMKTNNNDSNGGMLCGVTGTDCPTGDWRQSYANYLVQYLRFYQQEGINLTHVGFLNEPDLIVYYASMVSSGTQAADVLPILRSTLDAAGFSHVEIACCEATGWQEQGDMLTEIQLAGAEDTMGVVASHGYSSQPKLPLPTTKKVWQTEWADLDGTWTTHWDVLGKAGEGLVWANHIQNAIRLSNCSAFIYWQGAENTTGNSALISFAPGDEVHVSKRLWAMGQFSRFVKPGSVRVEAEVSLPLLHSTAYEMVEGGVALVVINNGHVDYETEISVRGGKGGAGMMTPWVTNNDFNATAQEGVQVSEGGSWRVTIPARSMVTYVM
ncbi:hypothetical protein PMZ80_002590 [Knufia obscura]|uniref:Uncharacterized protein n=2 Tax=Knufia TaxID=430999 RepID=A0AAN8F4W7_9EURO|nr:hypothetical protein PMZ80_002590 [Knufia obscura]KAK5951371.1 hypothetical protein OHC33_007427 [Knufia fluminis]